jgi:hypothetical protein
MKFYRYNTKGIDKLDGIEKEKKYKNKKVDFDGHKFDSRHEFNFYNLLKLNNIDFTLKEVFILQNKFTYGSESIREIKIIPDFIIKKNGVIVAIVDTKGMITIESKLKYKMLKNYFFDKGIYVPIFMPTNKKTSLEVITKLLHEI